MSWDVYIEADLGGPEPMSEWIGNYTSNAAPMWNHAVRAALNFDCPRTYGLADLIHGKRAGDCADTLDRAIHEMLDNPGYYERMNPENGWGDADGALLYLVTIRDAARRYPRGVFRVSR